MTGSLLKISQVTRSWDDHSQLCVRISIISVLILCRHPLRLSAASGVASTTYVSERSDGVLKTTSISVFWMTGAPFIQETSHRSILIGAIHGWRLVQTFLHSHRTAADESARSRSFFASCQGSFSFSLPRLVRVRVREWSRRAVAYTDDSDAARLPPHRPPQPPNRDRAQ